MMRVESSTTIAGPAQEILAFVTDVRNDPRWHTDVLEAWLTEGTDVGRGSVFGIRFKPFMGQSEGTMTVAEHEPGRRTVLTGRMGPLAPTTTLTVEPNGGGTRFTRRVEMEPVGMLRIIGPLMKGTFRRHNEGFLANLKRELEGS